MEQYPVPQFIEQEGKMISFLTFRQFIYLVVAGIVVFAAYKLLPSAVFMVIALVVGGGGLGLAFYKVDGVPILTVLLNSIGFIAGSRSYTWKKKESLYPFKTIARVEIKKIEEHKPIGIGQKSGLKNLRNQVELRTK